MKSLLNALQEGRLIELTDTNKEKALQYLATLIEAIPDHKADIDIAKGVLEREQASNTGLGRGWGCPHIRIPQEGELLCAVGWSPQGVDYGSPDNKPVHFIIMYYGPDTQKVSYLKEISMLAKAAQSQPALASIDNLTDLAEARDRLLDMISFSTESCQPDAKARMIRLEAKQRIVSEASTAPLDFAKQFLALSILVVPNNRPVVLCQDKDLVAALEQISDLGAQLLNANQLDLAGNRLLLRNVTTYQPNRHLYDCLAIKIANLPSPNKQSS
jgi:mannitol/fructose-specific phosphotransferase system IIA component (Ntr-type)